MGASVRSFWAVAVPAGGLRDDACGKSASSGRSRLRAHHARGRSSIARNGKEGTPSPDLRRGARAGPAHRAQRARAHAGWHADFRGYLPARLAPQGAIAHPSRLESVRKTQHGRPSAVAGRGGGGRLDLTVHRLRGPGPVVLVSPRLRGGVPGSPRQLVFARGTASRRPGRSARLFRPD